MSGMKEDRKKEGELGWGKCKNKNVIKRKRKTKGTNSGRKIYEKSGKIKAIKL